MYKNIFISLVCGLVGSMIFTITYNKIYRQNFAVIKMRDVINAPLERFKKSNVSKDQIELISITYAEKLKKKIKEVEKRDNVILLVAPAVISKLPDYTSIIAEETMREFDFIDALKK